MAKTGRVRLRLDIIGLDPERFESILKNVQALVESKTKGSVSRMQSDQGENSSNDVYHRIALIALDFQRAYGRAVETQSFRKILQQSIRKGDGIQGKSI